jgi:uncharacterized protein YecE (DUF72 family)
MNSLCRRGARWYLSGWVISIRRNSPASEMLRYYAERFSTVEINKAARRISGS